MEKSDIRKLERALLRLGYNAFPDMYPGGVVYPPVGELPRLTGSSREAFSRGLDFSDQETDLYVHFPFCHGKCAYCDLLVLVSNDPARIGAYVDLLGRELRLVAERFGRKRLRNIHIGGGTPSAADTTSLGKMLDSISSAFDLSGLRQLSIEATPESLTEEKLRFLLGVGVTRISLGIQSLNADVVATQRRGHNTSQSVPAAERLAASGIKEFNFDFIYGLAGQGRDDISACTDLVRRLLPNSAYFYQFIPPGQPRLPRSMMKAAVLWLRRILPEMSRRTAFLYEAQAHIATSLKASGYAQGVQSFTRRDLSEEGYAATRHHNRSFLGVGIGAHSNTGGFWYRNTCAPRDYADSLQRGEIPLGHGQIMRPAKRATGDLLLRLRLPEGMSIPRIESSRGVRLLAWAGSRLA